MKKPKNFFERIHDSVRNLNRVPYRFNICADSFLGETTEILLFNRDSDKLPPIALILGWATYRDALWFELRQTQHGSGVKGATITNGLIPNFNLATCDKFIEYIDSLSKTHFEYHTRMAEIPEWLR